MIKRAIYYAARELSSQLNVVTTDTNYDHLEKVYSIWICNEKIPKDLKDSVIRYHLVRDDIIGICDEKEEHHDLMEVIMIRRGGDAAVDTIFEYLEGVFTSNLRTIGKYIDVDNNNEVKEALKTMCGLGESLEYKASIENAKKNARKLFENGVSYNLVRASIDILSDEELKEIYDEVMVAPV